MEEWKEYKLEQVCENIYSGGTPATMNKEYWNGELPWLSSGETGQKYIYSTEKTITRKGVDNSSTRYAFKDSTVVASAGQGYTRGQASYLKINTYVNQSVIVLKPNPNIIDSRFLYFNIDNRYNELRQLSDGTSTRGSLSGKIMKDLSIKLPPLSTQKKIAAILSSLDDKIELNNKINTNLEQQAQALFKNWFVDFAPFGGKMPEGWKVGKLSDIAEITMGQSPDGKSYNEDGIGTVFYQGRAEFGTRFPTRRLFTTEPKRIAKKFDTLMSVRAPVGDTNIANEDCCIGRGLAAIHSKDGHQSFVHYTVLSLRPQFGIFNGEGTVFGCINRDALNNMEVVIPAKDDLDKFEKIVASLDADIYNRSEENGRLKIIRDTLLPKLMNGEITV